MKNTINKTNQMGINAFQSYMLSNDVRKLNRSSMEGATRVVFLFGDKLQNAMPAIVEWSTIHKGFEAFSVNGGVSLACADDVNDYGLPSFDVDNMGGDNALMRSIPANTQKVLIAKADLVKLFDAQHSRFMTFHMMKKRKYHYCKECNEYYRKACRCLSVARIQSYQSGINNAFFFDSVEGKTQVKATTGNTTARPSQKTAFIGVEWEVTTTNRRSRQDNAIQFFKFFKKNGGTKHFLDLFNSVKDDSSVSNGFEMVTNPFSAKYYEDNQASFELMAQYARQQKLRGSGNGIHIHISRNAFTTETLAKFFKLFGNNSNIIEKLAGRRSNRWAKLELGNIPNTELQETIQSKYKIITSKTDAQFMALAKDNSNGNYNSIDNRYKFLNLSNAKTIEYRLPASTTDEKGATYSNFCRHIELMLGAFAYVSQAELELEEVSFESFLAFLEASNKYNNIYNCIVSNKEVLTLICGNNTNAERRIKGASIENISIDNTSAEGIQQARENVLALLDSIQERDEEEIEIIVNEKYNKLKLKEGV